MPYKSLTEHLPTKVNEMLRVISAVFILIVCLHQISSYNTNRQLVVVNHGDTCGYYDNPVFKATPVILQNRLGEIQSMSAEPVVLIDNRIRGESPYYNTYRRTPVLPDKYHAKVPLPLPQPLFPNIGPVDLKELTFAEEEPKPKENEEDEEDMDIDYERVWKVGEIPTPKRILALPDVYVKQEDDALSNYNMPVVERSDLTVEAHDMLNVELEERYLTDPKNEPEELIIERVTTRPEPRSTENPAIAMFKQIDIVENANRVKNETLKEPLKIKNKEKGEKKAIPTKSAVPETGDAKDKPNKDSAKKP